MQSATLALLLERAMTQADLQGRFPDDIFGEECEGACGV